VVIRAPSALFAVGTVLALYLLGRQLFGWKVGLLAGVLLASNAFFIHYAQEARAYTLVVLLVTLASYFLVRELEQPSRSNRLCYALFAALSVYSHYFAFFVLFVHLTTVVVLRRRGLFTQAWISLATATALLCAPALWFASRAGPAGISWIQPSSLIDLKHVAVDLAGGRELVLVIFLALGAYGIWAARNEQPRWPVVFVAAWFVLPIALSFLTSLYQPMFIVYYLLISVPAIVLLAAVGAVSLPSRLAAALLLALVLWQSGLELHSWYRSERVEDWQGAAHHVFEQAQARDSIVFLPSWAHEPFTYYRRQTDESETLLYLSPSTLKAKAAKGRVWVMMRTQDEGNYYKDRRQVDLALEGHRLMSELHFGSVEVELYIPREE
jgi:uncharacterized membrane protein